MIPAAFEYHAPKTLRQAVATLRHYDGEARVLAGGMSLVPMMKLRLANLAAVVDRGDEPGDAGPVGHLEGVGRGLDAVGGEAEALCGVPLLAAGRKPPFLAVKRPARPYKSTIENRFT